MFEKSTIWAAWIKTHASTVGFVKLGKKKFRNMDMGPSETPYSQEFKPVLSVFTNSIFNNHLSGILFKRVISLNRNSFQAFLP